MAVPVLRLTLPSPIAIGPLPRVLRLEDSFFPRLPGQALELNIIGCPCGSGRIVSVGAFAVWSHWFHAAGNAGGVW